MNASAQCKGVKGCKEKKNVSGWSIEEMKETPNVAVEEDTEEMRNCRGLSNFAILSGPQGNKGGATSLGHGG